MGNKNQKGNLTKELTQEEINELKLKTNYTQEEILLYHKRFLEICPKGEFDRKNFVDFFSSLRPDKDAELFCSQLFDGFDTNKSGKVDFYEFLIAISLSSDKDPRSKLRFAFNMYDYDKNKKLDINEIENIIKAINRFSGQRENKSGNQPSPREIAKHLLKKFDRDANGFLTEDEFIDEAITFPTLHALNSFSILRDGLLKNQKVSNAK